MDRFHAAAQCMAGANGVMWPEGYREAYPLELVQVIEALLEAGMGAGMDKVRTLPSQCRSDAVSLSFK